MSTPLHSLGAAISKPADFLDHPATVELLDLAGPAAVVARDAAEGWLAKWGAKVVPPAILRAALLRAGARCVAATIAGMVTAGALVPQDGGFLVPPLAAIVVAPAALPPSPRPRRSATGKSEKALEGQRRRSQTLRDKLKTRAAAPVTATRDEAPAPVTPPAPPVTRPVTPETFEQKPAETHEIPRPAGPVTPAPVTGGGSRASEENSLLPLSSSLSSFIEIKREEREEEKESSPSSGRASEAPAESVTRPVTDEALELDVDPDAAPPAADDELRAQLVAQVQIAFLSALDHKDFPFSAADTTAIELRLHQGAGAAEVDAVLAAAAANRDDWYRREKIGPSVIFGKRYEELLGKGRKLRAQQAKEAAEARAKAARGLVKTAPDQVPPAPASRVAQEDGEPPEWLPSIPGAKPGERPVYRDYYWEYAWNRRAWRREARQQGAA